MNLIRCWPDLSLCQRPKDWIGRLKLYSDWSGSGLASRGFCINGFLSAIELSNELCGESKSTVLLESVGVAPYEGDFPAVKRGVVPPDAFMLDPRESPLFNEVPGCLCTTDVTEDSKFDFFSSIGHCLPLRLFFFLADSMMIITHTNPMIKEATNTTRDRINWRGRKLTVQ